MKIIRLQAENIKRLKAVEITPDPDGNLVIVSGRNEQGKTSVLDSIMYALGGAGTIPSQPVRQGEKEARVQLDLGDIIVTRNWTKQSMYLKVENGEGALYKSPQKLLDSLVGRLSFDPLEFSRLGAREQRATLLELAELPINLDELAAKRRGLEEERRDHGRDLKKLQAQLEACPQPGVTPEAEEKSIAVLSQQLRAEQARMRTLDELKEALNNGREEQQHLRDRIKEYRDEIERIELKLGDFEAAIPAFEKSIAEFPPSQEEKIQAEIDSADEFNRKVRQARRHVQVSGQVAGLENKHGQAQAAINALDKGKAEALASAKLPIEGLGLEDDEVTFEGVPFDQLADSQKLRVSLAMAMALNPKLRVIRITNGSLLDSSSLAIVQEMIQDKDFQLWMERVDESGKVGVVIEDGMVKEE